MQKYADAGGPEGQGAWGAGGGAVLRSPVSTLQTADSSLLTDTVLYPTVRPRTRTELRVHHTLRARTAPVLPRTHGMLAAVAIIPCDDLLSLLAPALADSFGTFPSAHHHCPEAERTRSTNLPRPATLRAHTAKRTHLEMSIHCPFIVHSLSIHCQFIVNSLSNHCPAAARRCARSALLSSSSAIRSSSASISFTSPAPWGSRSVCPSTLRPFRPLR